MQSLQNLARVASVDRELFETRVHMMLDLCSARDMAGLLAHFAEDISFQAIGNWNMFPFPGPVRGKAATSRALGIILTQVQCLDSEVHDIVVDGDRVAVRRTARLRHLGTGRSAGIAVVDFLRFRDGLVTELTELLDSLAMAGLEEG